MTALRTDDSPRTDHSNLPLAVSRRLLLRRLGGLLSTAPLALALQPRTAAAQVVAPSVPPTASPTPPPTATPLPTVAPTSGPTAAPTAAPTLPPAPTPTPLPWVQALKPLEIWGDARPESEALEYAARWDYFEVLRPQQGPRLYVRVARTRSEGWVDALSVGPSGPPPAGWPPTNLAEPPADLSVGWVAVLNEAPIWADATGTIPLGIAPAWSTFKQMEPQNGPHLRLQDPYSSAEVYGLATDMGPIDAPAQLAVPGRWWGVLRVDGAYVRAMPTRLADPVAEVPLGTPVIVSAWVEGEEVLKDNPTWAMLAEGAYMHSSVLRPVAYPSAPPPLEILSDGKWIDLNLTHQFVVAYEGAVPVYAARVSTGRPGWETNIGVMRISRRVEKETMDSSTLLGQDAQRAAYKIENIRWTQYFTADGKALHENYWKPRDEFGMPSSHGCVGLVAEDASFFWDWAQVGTPIYSHFS